MLNNSKLGKAVKNDSTPIRMNPTSQASNRNNAAVSPLGATGGSTDPPCVNNNKPSQLIEASSLTRALQQLCNHMEQLKRAASPCTDFKRPADNPWLRLLTQIHDDQKSIIREQSDLIMKLQSDALAMHKANQDLSARVGHLEHELSSLRISVTNFKPAETSKKQEEMLQKLENHFNSLQQQHTATQDESDQLKLLDSVIISSQDFPHETDREDCTAIVIQELRTKLNYSIEARDIKSAYRVGTKSSGANNRRIRVKLDSCSRKSDLITAAVARKSKVYVNECLTRFRQNLLFKLRGICNRSTAIKHCFVRDGKIIARKTDSGKTYVITTEAHLTSFLDDCGISAE